MRISLLSRRGAYIMPVFRIKTGPIIDTMYQLPVQFSSERITHNHPNRYLCILQSGHTGDVPRSRQKKLCQNGRFLHFFVIQ